MRVIVVGRSAYAPWINGEAVLARDLALCLSTATEVTVVTDAPQDPGAVSTFIDAGITVRSSSRAPGLQGDVALLRETKRAIRDSVPAETVVDLVGANAMIAAGMLRGGFRKVRHLYMPSALTHDQTLPLTRWPKRAVYKSFDGIVCTSEHVRTCEARNLGTHPRTDVIPPPIDTDRFSPGQAVSSIVPDRATRPVILYLGPLTPTRSPIDEFVRMLQALHDSGVPAFLLLIGRGTKAYPADAAHLAALQAKVKRLGLSDYFHGEIRQLTEQEKVELYRSVDIVLQPFISAVALDPPITLLEAMACGAVTLSTPVQGIGEYITNGETGLLVPVPTGNQLAGAIVDAWMSGQLRAVANNARELVAERCGFRVTRDRLVAFYSEGGSKLE